MADMTTEDTSRPRMHMVNTYRWRTGRSGRPLTPRRAGSLGLLEREARPEPAEAPSTTDELVVESGRRRGQARLDRIGRRAERRVRRADRLAARVAALRRDAAERRSAATRSPSGAALTPERHGERHERLRALVEDGGEVRHRRVARAHRVAARVLPWVDGLLFAYFVAGVSNADLAAPWTTPVASLVALAFTAFGVLTVAVFTPWLGRSLRVHKRPDGQLRFAEIGGVATALLTLWLLLVLTVGVTMVVRVRTEAAYAGADAAASGTVAALLALAAVAMTAYVLGVAIADGTPESDDLCVLGRDVLRREAWARGRERRAGRLERRRLRLVRAVLRREVRARAEAGAELLGTDRTVDLVRLRLGTPADRPRPVGPDPADLDERHLAAVRADLATAPFE